MSNLPRKAIYMDIITGWSNSEIMANITGACDAGFNVIILCFYLPTGNPAGPWDVAKGWSGPGYLTEQDRQKVLTYVHGKGGIILVSAGGATEFPYDKISGTNYGTTVATWAKENSLDGIDYDFEHFNVGFSYGNMTSCQVLQWIGDCFTATKQVMGNNSILTSAPQPPYFEPAWVGKVPTGCLPTSSNYETGGYIYLEKYYGNLIDWYNVQFYNNGGNECFSSYEGLFIDSGKAGCIDFPDLAVMQINNYGIPLQKIVVGKPLLPSDVGSGYVQPSDLGQWVAQAKTDLGWNAGVMTWQWHDPITAKAWINAVYPGSSNDSNDSSDSLPDWVWAVVALMIVFFIAMVVLASLFGIEKNKNN